MMYQYPEEALKKASEELGRLVSNEELFVLRAQAVAYFISKGKEHAEQIIGGNPIGDHNIKMMFGDD